MSLALPADLHYSLSECPVGRQPKKFNFTYLGFILERYVTTWERLWQNMLQQMGTKKLFPLPGGFLWYENFFFISAQRFDSSVGIIYALLHQENMASADTQDTQLT